jgi:tRNA dimethylallyltransferase
VSDRAVLVIAGPTASGKSGLALAIAREFGGVVINADSMQIYDALPILTARPGPADLDRVPHRLYGILAPDDPCSAARWRDLAAAECRAAWAAGRLPIVVGGTGMYLGALMQGLSPIPDVPDATRAEARARLESLGNAAFHAALAEIDPTMAARLAIGDSQRMVRAWEVWAATGRSLAEWQAMPREGGLDAGWFTLALLPGRDALNAAAGARFQAMITAGAINEAAEFMARGLAPSLPVMKVLGLRELAAHAAGATDRATAVNDALAATRAYAKRQVTWIRHQVMASEVISTQLSESLIATIFSKIRLLCLTGAGHESTVCASRPGGVTETDCKV